MKKVSIPSCIIARVGLHGLDFFLTKAGFTTDKVIYSKYDDSKLNVIYTQET